VFKEILRAADEHEHVLVNTHATFRWRHGLFAAFDFDQLKTFNADLYITMLDNARTFTSDYCAITIWTIPERHHGLARGGAVGDGDHRQHHARAWPLFHDRPGAERPDDGDDLSADVRAEQRKVYLSFPMSHVMDLPDTLAEIDAFKATINEQFICFDPADVDDSCCTSWPCKPWNRAARQSRCRRPTARSRSDPGRRPDQRRHPRPNLRARFQDDRSV